MLSPHGGILAVACCLLLPHTLTHAARKGVWRRVEAVAGREAVLPCEVGPLDSSDMVFVVLWYTNGEKEPIYSYDNRPGRLQAPEERHTIKSKVLEGRATFRPGQVPALHIKPVLSTDQANYTCRVDFRIASSRRTHLNLQVVEPPGQPVLMVAGQRITEGVLGPLQEGSSLTITCSVVGGIPPPSLVWKKHNKVLESTVESRTGGLTVNQLSLPHLSRAFHSARLTCVATNNNVTSPVHATLTITMNLRPLLTRLEDPPKSLRVGKEYHISCLVAGSRPHPNITWTLGNVASHSPILAETEHGVNTSTSLVTVTASRRHHGQRLTCTSINPLFPAYPLSDSILLNVTYPPVATIELGRGVSPVVREGEDVYFNCNVDSNPPTYKISWLRDGKVILHSPETGVVVSGNNLALRGVTRHLAGPYVCLASNVEGDVHSLPLNLTVNYAPVCEESDGEADVYAAGVGQYINVTCRVVASPSSLKYSWVFNNSVTSERLPGNLVFTTPDGRSVVQFMAKAHQDYGTLQCWAQNSVGRMTQPCLFHVIPAGRPERPVACVVVNKTYDSLVVGCRPGFDGGLPQTFTAKVFEAVTGQGQAKVTSNSANFTLEGLTPGLDYVIHVVATNSLGDSEPVTLEAFTYKMAENRMRDEKVEEAIPEAGPEQGVVMGHYVVVATVAAVVGLVVMVVTVRCLLVRRHHHQHHPSTSNSSSSTTTNSRNTKGLVVPELPRGSLSASGGLAGASAHTDVSLELAEYMYGHPGQHPGQHHGQHPGQHLPPPPAPLVQHEKK